MRRSILALTFAMLLAPGVVRSDEIRSPTEGNASETYRGHYFDLSALAHRKDAAAMTTVLRQQIDMVEDLTDLSPQVLDFFRTIPISVNEVACLDATRDKDGKEKDGARALLHVACYTNAVPGGLRTTLHGSSWDEKTLRWTNDDPIALAEDTNRGVVLVRPFLLNSSFGDSKRPVILHELLHAYHKQVMPQSFGNAGIKRNYDLARSAQLYPAEAYLMSNDREFFAVTASVFLHGNDGPLTRAKIREKQPDYYKYLVALFGFDPDRKSGPVASAAPEVMPSPAAVSTATK